MSKKLLKQKDDNISVDIKAGSFAYNRFEMQVSQVLHMAIELYPNLNYLLVLDHYDDITLFDHDVFPEFVSYYQMKTSEDSISINTALSEDWIVKLHEHLNNPEWMVKELGLITNCPLKVSVTFKDNSEKSHRKENIYTAERTPFLSFNPIMVDKIKKDIAAKKGIAASDVDLSKYVHMRTTLTISKHNEIVEQEMSSFLHRQYPRITVESVKTIYNAMMVLLSQRQSCENLDKSASFAEIRHKKGISKSDFSRIIKDSMYISVPDFEEIDTWMGYSNEEKPQAALEYATILSDIKKSSDSFNVIFHQVKTAFCQNPQYDGESVKAYCERLYELLPLKNPIYNKIYVTILAASMIINKWRRSL